MRSPLRPVAAIVRAVAAPAVGAAAFALSSVAAAQTVVIDPTLPIAAQVPSTSTNPPTGPTAPTTATPPATQAPALSTTSAPTAPSPEPLAGWYGFETLAVDAAGLVAGGIAYNVQEAGGARPSHRVTIGGALTTGVLTVGGLGAPAVHLANGNVSSAGVSAQMRIVYAPMTAYLIGFGYCLPRSLKNCWTDGLTLGNGITLGAASVIDALVLAKRFVPRDAPTAPPPPRGTWYGWQLASADAIALGTSLAVGSRVNFETKDGATYTRTFNIGMTYALLSIPASPIIHLVHRHPERAALSLGAHLFLPVAVAMYGALAYCSTAGAISGCLPQGAEGGVLVGALAASVFDAGVLGVERAQPTYVPVGTGGEPNLHAAVRRPVPPSMQVAPTFTPRPGGGLVAIAGTF